MAKSFLLPEVQHLKDMEPLYDQQANKSYNYILEDFIITEGNSWKHKDWNTLCQGCDTIADTVAMINMYIAECNKPLSQRNLDFLHLSLS